MFKVVENFPVRRLILELDDPTYERFRTIAQHWHDKMIYIYIEGSSEPVGGTRNLLVFVQEDHAVALITLLELDKLP